MATIPHRSIIIIPGNQFCWHLRDFEGSYYPQIDRLELLTKVRLMLADQTNRWSDANVAPASQSWLRLARIAKILAALTLVWLGIEGTVGVVAGILAGSIALVAFGLDSAIEGLASVIVIWRFTGTQTISPVAERQAQKWVAVSF
jgi:hypothetical protein